LIDPDSVRTEYTFDELNRLETLTLDDGQAVTYEYFPDSLKKTVTNPNGTVSTYLYDAADRMTSISHVGPSGVISAYDYDYDPNSNRERQVEQNAGRTETTEYTYDFVNRLKTVTYPDRAVAYEYDLAGNRIQEVTTGAEASDETFHYDAINRLERITDTVTGTELTRYAYDPNGNTTSKSKAGVTTNFFFDIRNQLGEVRQASNVLGRYGYDYDGRRILKIGDDGRRQYTYDQLSVVTEADQVNATVSKYDYGTDQLVRLDNRSEGRSFFHLDFLGSTVGLTNNLGTTRQSIFYDAWGNERDRIGSSANNFTFTGHELDKETGLIYAKARFYDAEVGRFISQDDVLGEVSDPPDLHRYAYAQMNPLFFVDPTGNIEIIQDLRKKIRETKEGLIDVGVDVSESEGVERVPFAGRFIAERTGRAGGLLGFADSTLGIVNFGLNLVVGLGSTVAPDSKIAQQSAQEITEAFDEFSNTARVVKETGFGQVGLAVAVTAGDKLYQAAKGDKRALAEVNAFATEIAVDIFATGGLAAASKGKTALKVTKEATEEIVEQTAKRGGGVARSVLEGAAGRHEAWAKSITTINETAERLGQRALRSSGGDWRKAEKLFRSYLGGVERRLRKTGSSLAVEWQPAAIPGRGRVPAFRNLVDRSGLRRIFATKGSRRLDAGIVDLTSKGPLHQLVSGFDITLDASKPSIVRYYQEAFGEIPILDIRLLGGT
jgi:RHS repeat-associated protein